MITTNQNVKDIFDKNVTVKSNIGCTIEYNMNSLVDNIQVTSPNDYKTFPDGTKPFKKLFPIDTVIKPFRPLGAGIKYGIFGDVSLNSYTKPSSTNYQIKYRTYYPGVDTYYKYWVTPIGEAVNITITYPKTIIANKIVARFELSHSTPETWTIYGNGSQLATGSSVRPFETSGSRNYDAGSVVIYYTGSGWTTDAALHDPTKYVSLNSIRLTTGAISGKYIGVIEFSPRWVQDVTSSIVDFSIMKESSTGADDVLPVGRVSANSMSMAMNSYDSKNIVVFSKELTIDPTKVYLYKQVEIKPFLKVYHDNGTSSDSAGSYDAIPQGTFYADNWSISEYGDVNLTALDGAKILQEILAPSLLCEKYSAVAIIRRLLDSVGFTNYNFNIATNDQSVFSPTYWWTDDSKPVWSSIQELCRDSQMVAIFDEYNVLQFYTRDYIFNASRPLDWTFRYANDGDKLSNIAGLSKRDLPSANQVLVRWNSVTTSNYAQDAQPLWKSGTTYMGALSLQQSLLSSQLPVQDAAGNYTAKVYISLVAITTNEYQSAQALYEYNGYLVVNSEIIEYDAIEYKYNAADGSGWHDVDITSDADVLKYQGLAAIGSDNYYPTGRYRVKTRAAFGTKIADHYAAAQDIIDSWPGFQVVWGNGTTSSSTANVASVNATTSGNATPSNTSTSSAEAGNNKVSKSLFTITNNSKDTTKYSLAEKTFNFSTSEKYYSFGTSMFFQSTVDATEAGGGIGFFASANGLNGYYVLVQTTSNLSSKDDREIKILKVVNGKIIQMQDTQTTVEKQISGVYGGTAYKLDIKVKIETVSGIDFRVIDVYVNGRKITAIDKSATTETDPEKKVLPVTSRLAMFSMIGKSNFDYIYAIPLTEEKYKNGPLYNVYTGQYANTTLDFLFGDKVLSNLGSSSTTAGIVEEFGTTARELRKVSVKYNSRPGYPIYPSTGVNNFIQIIGSKLSSFGAEVYLLNNAGTYVPLDDAGMSSFSIIGNYVVQSGQHDYLESSINEYTTPEPVIFESTWIQTEADARGVSKWIKNQWSKQQRVVDLTVFANPLVSVGDVITINYPSNDLDGTQKFIVTSVANTYNQGLETTLTARSIYS